MTLKMLNVNKEFLSFKLRKTLTYLWLHSYSTWNLLWSHTEGERRVGMWMGQRGQGGVLGAWSPLYCSNLLLCVFQTPHVKSSWRKTAHKNSVCLSSASPGPACWDVSFLVLACSLSLPFRKGISLVSWVKKWLRAWQYWRIKDG